MFCGNSRIYVSLAGRIGTAAREIVRAHKQCKTFANQRQSLFYLRGGSEPALFARRQKSDPEKFPRRFS
jgi:hypothetical protein